MKLIFSFGREVKVYVKSITKNLSGPKSDQPPFNINRFGKEELLNKITSKKPTLNRRLDFVDDPTSFELFTGLGRFDNGRTNKEDPSNEFILL